MKITTLFFLFIIQFYLVGCNNHSNKSKKVNKIELNGIKDVDADLIFERINRSIKNENK